MEISWSCLERVVFLPLLGRFLVGLEAVELLPAWASEVVVRRRIWVVTVVSVVGGQGFPLVVERELSVGLGAQEEKGRRSSERE